MFTLNIAISERRLPAVRTPCSSACWPPRRVRIVTKNSFILKQHAWTTCAHRGTKRLHNVSKRIHVNGMVEVDLICKLDPMHCCRIRKRSHRRLALCFSVLHRRFGGKHTCFDRYIGFNLRRFTPARHGGAPCFSRMLMNFADLFSNFEIFESISKLPSSPLQFEVRIKYVTVGYDIQSFQIFAPI